MNYSVKIKKKSDNTYSELDIFPDTVINFDLDFYDVDNIDKIKVPISINMDIPMTQNNIDLIEYDPSSSTNNVVPFNAFDIILSLDSTDIILGDMYVENYSYNNNTPVVGVRIVDKIQGIFKEANSILLSDMYSDYDSTMTFDALMALNEGTVNTLPTLNSILFPHIDFTNDLEKFSYEARQFIQFGFNKNATGLVPVFNVKDFVSRFFTEVNVGVVSRFFQLGNYTTAISNVDPDHMYMALPVRLRASTRTKERSFYLVEGPYNYYINEYTGDLEANETTVKEADMWPDSTGSWNYNNVQSPSKTITDFGTDVKYDLPNDFDNLTRSYFGSSQSYTGVPLNTSWQLPANSHISVDIPMIRVSERNYAAVKSIDIPNSTAQFIVKSILWVDGYPSESFKLCNTDGSVKVLNVSQATLHNFQFTTGMRASTGTSFEDIEETLSDLRSQLRFSTSEVGSFIWEQKEYEVLAGSTYGISIEIEILNGQLRFEKVDSWQLSAPNSTFYVPNQTSFTLHGDEKIGKMIYREDFNNIGNLYLSLKSINGTFNPYFGTDDDVNVFQSIRDNETEVIASDVLKEILKRFNLSIVFDQNTNSVLIDRLPDIRSLNTTTDIENKLDDARSINVEIVNKIAKSLDISGLDDLFFDDHGYETVTLNTAGSDELKFELKSRFYNKSLCGDYVDAVVPAGFNEYEIGLTTNAFTPVTDLGITFGYIAEPLYKTNLKRARFEDKDDYKGLVYDTYDSHVFAGRFRKDRSGSIKLYHFDELGQSTDLYDFFVGNDNINYYSKPKVKFNALMDQDYAYNIKDNYSNITMPYVNSNGIIIKSVKGELFGSGIYSTVEGIIL